MITPQTKNLKNALKAANVRDNRGRLPMVRVERFRKVDRGIRTIVYYEYGNANAIVRNDDLSADQMAHMKEINPHIKFFRQSIYTVISL